MLNRFVDCHIAVKVDKFRGHNASGGVCGILEHLVYHLPCLGVCLLENSLNYAGGHFFNDINRIVKVKLVNNVLQLLIRKTLDKVFSLLG